MIRKGLWLSLAPLAVIVGAGAWGFIADPAGPLPVHWDLDGRPDRYGGRFEAFLTLPLIAVAVTALMAVLPALDPRGCNLRRSGPAYLTSWIGGLWLMALIQVGAVTSAVGLWDPGAHTGFPRIVTAAAAVFVVLLGNVLGKARSNWFLGVRTPWTLSSDIAWDRTHRMAGRLLVLVGLVGLAAAFLLPTGAALLTLVGGLIAASAWSALYSWRVWRDAPDKRTGPHAVDQ